MPKKVNNPTYTTLEKNIMRTLYQTKLPLTAYEISKRLKISFPTAKKHLKTLVEKGVITEDEIDGSFQKN